MKRPNIDKNWDTFSTTSKKDEREITKLRQWYKRK